MRGPERMCGWVACGVVFFPSASGNSRLSPHVKVSLLVRCVMLSSKTVPERKVLFGVQCTRACMLAWGFLFPVMYLSRFLLKVHNKTPLFAWECCEPI